MVAVPPQPHVDGHFTDAVRRSTSACRVLRAGDVRGHESHARGGPGQTASHERPKLVPAGGLRADRLGRGTGGPLRPPHGVSRRTRDDDGSPARSTGRRFVRGKGPDRRHAHRLPRVGAHAPVCRAGQRPARSTWRSTPRPPSPRTSWPPSWNTRHGPRAGCRRRPESSTATAHRRGELGQHKQQRPVLTKAPKVRLRRGLRVPPSPSFAPTITVGAFPPSRLQAQAMNVRPRCGSTDAPIGRHRSSRIRAQTRRCATATKQPGSSRRPPPRPEATAWAPFRRR